MDELKKERAESLPVALDEEALSGLGQRVPEAFREDTLWLARLVRNRFDGSVPAAAREFRLWAGAASGCSDSLLTKLLNATYWPDDGTDLTQRIANQRAFVARLRERERLERVQSAVGFVETSTWELIRDDLDIHRAPGTVCRWSVVVGDTGTGKSAGLKQYSRIAPSGQAIYFEAPERPSAFMLIEKLATATGVREKSHDARMRALREPGRITETTVIIVDNAQDQVNARELSGGERRRLQPAFSALRALADDTGCAVCLSFTPYEAKWLTDGFGAGYFEQFEGRAGGREKFLRLPRFATAADVHRIARAFGLKEALAAKIKDKGEQPEWLEKLVGISQQPGLIRILFHALQDGRRRARVKEKEFTMDFIKT